MSDEIVDVVSETGRVLHKASKHEAHKHGWLHKAVIGYVRHGAHWTLIRQSADRQDPGQLVAPVGGHVKSGEADLKALLREAEEEIGVKNIRHNFVGTARFHRQVIGRDENHLFMVYEISTDDELVVGPEGEAFETFIEHELAQALVEMPHKFGEALYFVLEHFYPHLLPGDYKLRWKVT